MPAATSERKGEASSNAATSSAAKKTAIRKRTAELICAQRVESGQSLNDCLRKAGGVVAVSQMANDNIRLSVKTTLAVTASDLKGSIKADDRIVFRNTAFSGKLTCDTLYILDDSVVSGEIVARVIRIDNSEVAGIIRGAEIVQRDKTSRIQVDFTS